MNSVSSHPTPWYRRFLRALTEPSPAITSEAERREARLLATLLTTFLVLYAIPEAIRAIERHQSPFAFGAMTLTLLMAYALSRSPAYRWGGRLTLGVFTLTPFLSILFRPTGETGPLLPTLIWSLTTIILGSLFLGARATGGLFLANLGLITALPLLRADIAFADVAYPAAFVAVGAILLMTAAFIRQVDRRRIAAQTDALQRQEAIFHTLTEATTSAIFVHRGGKFVYVNPATEHITGYSREELLAMNFWEIAPPDWQERVRSDGLYRMEMSLTKPTHYELPIRRKDGKIRHIHTTTGLVPWEGEMAIIGTGYDLSKLRRAEEQVLTLSQAIEQSASSVVITNPEGTIEYVNPAFTRVTGYTKEEALGQNPRILKSGLHPPEFYRRMWETLGRGETWRGELANKKKNGELYWEEATISPVLDENGVTRHYVAVKTDITERKERELELRKMYQAADQSASGIVITNAQGIIEYVNPAFTKMTGYRAEEAIGQPSSLLKSGKHGRGFYEEMWRTIETQESVWRGEIVNQRKDGSLYWEFQTISPVKDEQGRITHYVAIKEDITQRKELEEALQHSRDEALQASRLKTQLLGNVSHDMRTPLGAIVGYTEMLQTGIYGLLSEEQDKAIQAIGKSSRQLLDFVNDLLNQAQIESGKISLRPSPFPPAHLLDLVGADIALAQGQGLEIITDVDPALPQKVVGDRYWIGQILRNLVSNAIKFTEQGHIRIALQHRGDEHWAIQVSDTGQGIPPEAQEYIFEAFRQVDGSPSRKEHTGSGLGLSIVKHLAELMQGEVQLHSKVGEGTTFTVILPLILEIEEKAE